MELLFYISLFFLWFLSGWLPSRLMKHYFLTRFGPTLGESEAWGLNEELLSILLSIAGPASSLGTLIAWLRMTSKWYKGWKW